MQRTIITTNDGSHTLALSGTPVTYHSHHGAIGESRHVFIEAGFQFCAQTLTTPALSILEIGFGTGLNALLTYQIATQQKIPVGYTALELHPITETEAAALNYGSILSLEETFTRIHQSPWEKTVVLDTCFSLHKIAGSLLLPLNMDPVHLIYFDAFSPLVQPELWTKEVFEKLSTLLLPGGCLVTYSSKSVVRKAMVEAGFTVTKIPGPWGKREMVRAVK